MILNWAISISFVSLRLWTVLEPSTKFRACAKRTDSDSYHAWADTHLGICSLFIPSIMSNDSVSGQWRSWSDCMDAQADVDLRCPHMHENIFSHGTAYLVSSAIFTARGPFLFIPCQVFNWRIWLNKKKMCVQGNPTLPNFLAKPLPILLWYNIYAKYLDR